MAAFWRKYNTATASGTHIGIPMPKAGTRDFATSSDWTPATGDVKVSKDSAAEANIGTLPAYTNGHWIFQLTGSELTCKSCRVKIVDSATKAVDDNEFIVETYGDASALHVFDFSTSLAAQVIAAIGDKGDGLFDPATDSTQAIRDQGDANWASTVAMQTGTAQAGAAGTITLAAAASSVNSFYNGANIMTTGGTGAGQERVITAYVGATRVATLDANWVTNPDATTTYEIAPGRAYAAAGSITTVTGNVNGNVTGSVGSVTTVSDKTGYRLSATGVDDIWDDPIVEPTAVFAWASATPRKVVTWLAALNRNKITQTSTTLTLRNDADDATIATSTVSDDGTTAITGKMT